MFRLKSILTRYEEISGQLVNYRKTELCMGNNVQPGKATLLCSILGVKLVDKFDRYLGLPIYFGRRKVELFKFIENRIWKKVQGWKERLLSSAGKEIMIKSVIQAIPIYAMSCFKLPSTICNNLSSIVSKYWWNNARDKRYISWISKRDLCKPKEEGGMGFKHLDLVNDALLIKQATRILQCPDSLISRARVIKARYFPHSDLLSANLGARPSWAWRSIFSILKWLSIWFQPELTTYGVNWQLREGMELSIRKVYSVLLEKRQQEEINIRGDTSDKCKIRNFWRKVWRIKAQEKVKIFIWCLFKNALPSAMNLFRRGCEVDTKCIRCGYKFETTTHIFLECWWSAVFWKQLLGNTVSLELGFSSMADWVWYIVQTFDGEMVSLIFYGARWIWYSRNSLWHDGKDMEISEAVYKVRALVKEFLNPKYCFVMSREEAAKAWSPPETGCVKVNCDGAWDSSTGTAGLGYLCRNDAGQVKFVYAKQVTGLTNTVEVEGTSIYAAMVATEEQGICNATFVTDNVEVLQGLMCGSRSKIAESKWFSECRRMLQSHESWKVEHVFRDANKAADFLAAKARLEGWNWSSTLSIPKCISQVVYADLVSGGLV